MGGWASVCGCACVCVRTSVNAHTGLRNEICTRDCDGLVLKFAGTKLAVWM